MPLGTSVLRVDTCAVRNAATFYECLAQLERTTTATGYCTPTDRIFRLATSISTHTHTPHIILIVVAKIQLLFHFGNLIFAHIAQSDKHMDECCQANVSDTNYCFHWTSSKLGKQVSAFTLTLTLAYSIVRHNSNHVCLLFRRSTLLVCRRARSSSPIPTITTKVTHKVSAAANIENNANRR